MEAGSPASWELTLYIRTVIVAAGSLAAGFLAPCEIASYCRTAVSAGSAGAGSPAPYELALYRRTVIVAAGFVEAGSLAPCELTLRLRAVVVSAGSLAAGSQAPWELTSYLRSRLRGSRLPGSLRAYVMSSPQPAPWQPAPWLPVSSSHLHTVVFAAGFVEAGSL